MSDNTQPQVLVLAAGKGTRMKSGLAKVLHRALGLPLLEHVLRAVEPLNAAQLAVVVGCQADAVEEAFAGRGLHFVRQEPQLGTGHAVQVARDVVAAAPSQVLLVLYGDTPLLRSETLQALLDAHRADGAAATVLTCELERPQAYGRVVRGSGGRVERIVEAADCSVAERAIREINSGIYVFAVGPLFSVVDRLQSTNAQGERYLTDAIALLVNDGLAVQAVRTTGAEEILGVNSMAELAVVSERLRGRRLSALMASGVVVEDPATTWVGLDVAVEPDVVLRPFTILEGRTTIRGQARVGPFVRLVDSDIGAKAEILDHCLIRESTVGAGASVGPAAHLRPGSRIGARAKVGNFVELKKTELGEGSKAPHLTYLGDATIGAGVNVGAGTITCNYDGQRKYPTHIADGAFVGSSSTLVAPVSVGAGAYVGAGSTITEDVPGDALALGRARQVNKPGWAARRRQTPPEKKADEGR